VGHRRDRLPGARDGWKRHAAVTLRGDDAIALGETLAAWRDALAGEPGGPDDAGDDP
jgi:hypothetical protein